MLLYVICDLWKFITLARNEIATRSKKHKKVLFELFHISLTLKKAFSKWGPPAPVASNPCDADQLDKPVTSKKGNTQWDISTESSGMVSLCRAMNFAATAKYRFGLWAILTTTVQDVNIRVWWSVGPRHQAAIGHWQRCPNILAWFSEFWSDWAWVESRR